MTLLESRENGTWDRLELDVGDAFEVAVPPSRRTLRQDLSLIESADQEWKDDRHAFRGSRDGVISETGLEQDALASNRSSDEIDWNWKNWDIFDYFSACGIALIAIGFVTAVFPALRFGGVLLPIGLALMTLATYGARRRDTNPT
jgi:hypothetical protein